MSLPTTTAPAGNWWRKLKMNDDDFENIADKIIKVLQILFLAILCGLGMLLLITGIVTALS